jgi:hypothetical protein
MDRPRIYIETTIPSAYFDERTAPAMVARREATRRWWAMAGKYELVTSPAVLEELGAGPRGARDAWLALISDVRVLENVPSILDIVSAYSTYKYKVMPLGDSRHLAFASFHACDYLLTWDLRHLANPNKSVHIRWVNHRLGLFVPRIVAPPALMGGNHE